MEEDREIAKKIEILLAKHRNFQPEAFSFVLAALHETTKKMTKPSHISGQEFLEGIRQYALSQFGPMARAVFEHWGIKNTLDIGSVVFALVDVGLMRKRDEDSLEDFRNGYDFHDAFDKRYDFDES
jgi:uncharacterized repeat protein (TIGR04138 family)